MFQYNTIYYMKYTPATLGTIQLYDMYPLMLPLEMRGPIVLGLNMHHIPGPLRARFVQLVCEMRDKCINESMFRMFYRTLKYNYALNFALVGVRKYYISHCNNVRPVPQDKWDTITLANSLYRAKFMQRSSYNPQQHIIQRGPRIYPNQVRR